MGKQKKTKRGPRKSKKNKQKEEVPLPPHPAFKKDETKIEKPKPVQPKLVPTKKGTMPKILDKSNPWGAPSKLNKTKSIPKNALKPIKQNKNKTNASAAKRPQKKKKPSVSPKHDKKKQKPKQKIVKKVTKSKNAKTLQNGHSNN